MPGRPKIVSMPFSFSASITRLKPSISSAGCACGCGAADAAPVSLSFVLVTTSITSSSRAGRWPRRSLSVRVPLLADQARAARPLVLRAEHHHGRLGGVRIRRDAVVEQELGGFLDLDVARQRRDDR